MSDSALDNMDGIYYQRTLVREGVIGVLRAFLDESSLTQKGVAEILGIHNSGVSRRFNSNTPFGGEEVALVLDELIEDTDTTLVVVDDELHYAHPLPTPEETSKVGGEQIFVFLDELRVEGKNRILNDFTDIWGTTRAVQKAYDGDKEAFKRRDNIDIGDLFIMWKMVGDVESGSGPDEVWEAYREYM